MNLMSRANKYMIDNAEPGNLLDIGACTGDITIPMSESIKSENYKVYGFEPDPDAFGILNRNTEGSNTIEIFNMAISDKDGTIDLFLSQRGGHTTSKFSAETKKWGYNPERHIPIQSMTLDSWVKKYDVKDITGIKIDVEASEQFVLDGGKKTFTENKILIALETHDNIDCEKIFNILKNYGYTVFNNDMQEASSIVINRDYICKNY